MVDQGDEGKLSECSWGKKKKSSRRRKKKRRKKGANRLLRNKKGGKKLVRNTLIAAKRGREKRGIETKQRKVFLAARLRNWKKTTKKNKKHTNTMTKQKNNHTQQKKLNRQTRESLNESKEGGDLETQSLLPMKEGGEKGKNCSFEAKKKRNLSPEGEKGGRR